jgi:hypothetical protein
MFWEELTNCNLGMCESKVSKEINWTTGALNIGYFVLA